MRRRLHVGHVIRVSEEGRSILVGSRRFMRKDSNRPDPSLSGHNRETGPHLTDDLLMHPLASFDHHGFIRGRDMMESRRSFSTALFDQPGILDAISGPGLRFQPRSRNGLAGAFTNAVFTLSHSVQGVIDLV